MKLFHTVIFILFAIVAKGQDITFTLTHSGNRKWIGIEKTNSLNGTSSEDMIFKANHKVEQRPVNSHRSSTTQKWSLLSGNNINDEHITLQIGDVTYNVIFSKTSNGSDFITLT